MSMAIARNKGKENFCIKNTSRRLDSNQYLLSTQRAESGGLTVTLQRPSVTHTVVVGSTSALMFIYIP